MRHVFLICAMLLAACGKKPDASSPPAAAPSANAATETDQTQTLARLTQAVRKYAAETRNAPKSLDELVSTGYLPEAPTPPAGKQYVIDDQLRVHLK